MLRYRFTNGKLKPCAVRLHAAILIPTYSGSIQTLNRRLFACLLLASQGGLGSAGLVKGGFKHKDNGLPQNGKRPPHGRYFILLSALVFSRREYGPDQGCGRPRVYVLLLFTLAMRYCIDKLRPCTFIVQNPLLKRLGATSIYIFYV